MRRSLSMPKQAEDFSFDLTNAFYVHLRTFYLSHTGEVKKHYKKISKIYLDYNSPENPDSYLRIPQFEALEMYVFLKEYLQNKAVYQLFEEWFKQEAKFSGRGMGATSQSGQIDMLWEMSERQYNGIFKKMKLCNADRIYPNYIFALTMGTGKTILMATCIFYDFLLANKFPKDERFIHNALVFAPDKTVLQALRELETFDSRKVIPPAYQNVVIPKFHYLVDSGVSLSTIDGSKFNIVVSNAQKIILKRQNKTPKSVDKLFSATKELHKSEGMANKVVNVFGISDTDVPLSSSDDLITNQRFEKLRRLNQLGVYVDEAHHSFGANLAKDVGFKKDARKNSLRNTIDELSLSLKKRGTRLVACYNYTGTPYVGKEVLPEVVYAYGLKKAIDSRYLKKVLINSYTSTRQSAFLKIVIDSFFDSVKSKKPEGMLPKLAIFGTTVEEVIKEIKPEVERILSDRGVPSDKILVNVGDKKITTDDDIREFNRLDSTQSEKQIILLVNKGREGWNCRSLFGVALYREPKSKIFVLQATMRCLRSVGEDQETGQIYLTDENMKILEKELESNFRVSAESLQTSETNSNSIKVRPEPPPIKLKFKRIRRKFTVKPKEIKKGVSLGLDDEDYSQYRIIHSERKDLPHPDYAGSSSKTKTTDITNQVQNITFSKLTLTAEISRYLNKPCLFIEDTINATKEGYEGILKWVNTFNDVLYDIVIPRLFSLLFEVDSEIETIERDVELVKPLGIDKTHYTIHAKPEMVISKADKDVKEWVEKSFHLNHYCFDSKPEREFFWDMLQQDEVKNIWFTGMLTHGQSDFRVQYVDPETHTVRSYYPDFLIKKEDGSYVIVEIKGDNMLDDKVVKSKADYARSLASANEMTYELISGSQAIKGNFDRSFLL